VAPVDCAISDSPQAEMTDEADETEGVFWLLVSHSGTRGKQFS
jgi:hypothetical protein